MKMNKRLLFSLVAIMFFLAMLPFTLAAPTTDLWNRTCINDVETSLFCNGLCTNPGAILVNHTKVCANGCNNQTYTCDEPYNVPSEFFALAILGFIGVAGLFIVIAKVFPDDWKIMPILFYIMAIFFIVMAVGVMGSFFMSGQAAVSLVVGAAYLAAALIMFIFIAYIIMRYVVSFAISFIKGLKKRGR